MTFASDEQSVQDGSPIELYKFIGTYNTYRLTNRGEDVTNSDGTYDGGFAIRRSSLEEGTQEDDDISLDVDLSASHPMVTEYAINEPPPDLRLIVYRAHPTDLDDTLVLFDGEVVSWNIRMTREGRVASMKVPSLFSFLFDAPLPRPKYQAPCNHVLGDARCGVDMTDPANTHDTTISTITSNVIVVADTPFGDGECDGGEMIAGGERRMITGNVGTTYTISSPFSPGVSTSDAVTLRRGCDRALGGDCINRFDNAINFGGFPLVPNRNPFGGRL